MMYCPICLEGGGQQADGYHDECVLALLGPPPLAPRMGIGARDLTEGSVVEFGRGSISGVQPKVLVRRSADGQQLEVVGKGGLFILKPQTAAHRALPENEHTIMTLARQLGLHVPPCGLIRLADQSWAYIIRRFDRSPDGSRRIRQEDFCALAELTAEKKYDKGSAELCVRLLREHLAPQDVPVEVSLLFRQLLFSWWVGNGDLHLKNLFLTAGLDDRWRLTPAYDLVSTELVLPGDKLALPIGGKHNKLTRMDWLRFARYCGIDDSRAEAEMAHIAGAAAMAAALVVRSHLPQDMKDRLIPFLELRSSQLRV
jgi:serine/threonine-protein kinase HipA